VIYEPKSKYHPENKEPPKISKSFFGWLSPLIHVKEPELVDKVGLDATTFLRFLRMMRWLFTALGILGAVALIPGDAITQLRNPKLAKSRTFLSILTIQSIGGNLVYAHIAASYVFTALICGFVWMHWKAMADLRHAWFRSPEYAAQFYARTLQVTQVPKKFQSDEGLKAIFDSVQVPYPTTSVHIGRSVGALPELIEYHNNTVRELEKHLVRYLKGNKIGKHRPTIRVGGFLGIGGKKVDAIDYYSYVLHTIYSWSKKLTVSSNWTGNVCRNQKPRCRRSAVASTSGNPKTMDSPPWPLYPMHILSRTYCRTRTRKVQLSLWRRIPRTS
jgi:hypothetical protein